MESIKEELRNERVTGSAGGGMVVVTMNGAVEMLSVKLDPTLVENNETEMLEDLISAATNDAIRKAKEGHAKKIQAVTGDMNLPIPGIQEAIAKLTGVDADDQDDDVVDSPGEGI